MQLSKPCTAQPGHTENRRFNIGFRPVVISSDRFNGLLSRSRQDEKLERQLAQEEEQRYNQSLKDGGDALCKHFTNMPDLNVDSKSKMNMAIDKSLGEATKAQMTAKLLEASRKERIMRASRILNLMKPGPRALHQALLTTEVIHQRNYNQALKCEFAENAKRQQRLDEEQCPELLIPFGNVTEQEENAQQLAKSQKMREDYQNDLEARRLRKLADKEQEIFDGIVEREQYKCMQEKEEKAGQELAVRKREFCRRAYEDALKEKAENAKYSAMCDEIENRVNCVALTMKRNLGGRHGKEAKEIRAKRTRELEEHGLRLCREQQAKKRQMQELQDTIEERFAAEVEVDEARRQCAIKNLSEERRAYELKDRKRIEERRQREAEIRRFEIAKRYRNEEANDNFKEHAKRAQVKVTDELRNILYGQRQQFIDQRQEELMRMTACDEDPYLMDDVEFFDGAVKMMQESQKLGRPLYPLAKAAEKYRRENQLDMMPEGQMVHRSRRRDKCWPGYFSKAALAYRKYEHRENCRQKQEKERHKLFDNCIKITKMAAEERPYKRCTIQCPLDCIKHRGLPANESIESFDPPGFVCNELEPPTVPCSQVAQPKPPCKQCEGNTPHCLCPSIMEVMQPGEQYQSSEPCSSLRSVKPKTAVDSKSFVKDLTTVPKTESNQYLANSKRVSGGKQSAAAFTAQKRIARNTDLTQYWTSKPQPQCKAMGDQSNYPNISSIKIPKSTECKIRSIGISKSINRKISSIF
ncbi:intracellular protein transport protein USO1 [Drosophila grimshawi]|uniref:GH21003 n=1 Tax=Drosophila grimshawi TaxID=7222 RepID=B4J533_DROGR|nr:intracellular protein transport protein USO1 [Drosophila grimshawi]EDW00659.1 GH21003 [Drosophila grimshawi]